MSIILLQFVCSDESSNLITSVDEPETCTYTITIGCKDLCVHPLFKPKKKESVKEIICSPAISKDQYEQYLNQEQGINCSNVLEEIPIAIVVSLLAFL